MNKRDIKKCLDVREMLEKEFKILCATTEDESDTRFCLLTIAVQQIDTMLMKGGYSFE